MKIIIPARRNSKGLPFKNRKLLDFTLNKIPQVFLKNVSISTDDEEIIQRVSISHPDISILEREEFLAQDSTSTKDVLIDALAKLKAHPEETVVMLYLTYPERTWQDIEFALSFFYLTNSKSLLCKKEIETHPYLMMYQDGVKGKQIVKHDLYRRQDYPTCFEISHFISIFKVYELEHLNKNLYNEDTVYFPIGKVIDVDYLKDLENYNGKNNS